MRRGVLLYVEAHFVLGNDEVYRFWKSFDYQANGDDTAPVNVF